MASTQIKGLEIAFEPTFANLSVSSGYPTSSGLDFVPCEFIDASQLVQGGETLQDQTVKSSAGFGGTAPEALLTASGKIIKRGTLTLDFYLRSNPETLRDGLAGLLATRMNLDSNSAYVVGAAPAISGNVVTSEAGVAATGTDVVLFRNTDEDCSASYAHCVSVANTTSYTVTPGFGTVALEDATMRGLRSYYQPSLGGDKVAKTANSTVAIRITGDGWRSTCYGCSLTALTMSSAEDSRAVRCSATVDCAFIDDEVGEFTIEYPEVTAGKIFHCLNAPLRFGELYSTSTSIGASAENSAVTGACVDEWSLTMTWTCEATNCSNYYIGRGPLEASALEVDLSLVLGGVGSIYETLVNQWKEGKYSTIILGFSGDVSACEGGCVTIPAAYVKEGTVSNINMGKGFQRTSASFGAGSYLRDSNTGTIYNPMIKISLS